MNPFWLFLLAIFSPLVLSITLLAPLYGGITGAAYLVYDQGATHPLSGHWLNVFYMIDVYSQLFHYWLGHMQTVSFVNYTLPVVGLLLLALVISIMLTAKAAKMIMHLFHIAGSAKG
jgi:hypothetical protein